MDNQPLEKMTLLVPSSDVPGIEEYFNENGVVELVTRKVNKQYNTFVRAEILSNESISEEGKKIYEKSLCTSKENEEAISRYLSGSGSIQNKIEALDNSVKDALMQFDGLTTLSPKMQSLSFVNIALSMADITINAIGFQYISGKIDNLKNQIDKLTAGLSTIKTYKNEDIRRDFNKYNKLYKSYAKRIYDGDIIKSSDLEKDYLIDVSTFIEQLINLFKSESSNLQDPQACEFLLSMIVGLIPIYTSALCIYLRLYYFEKEKEPDYEEYLKVFKELDGEDFKTAIQHYLFLMKDYDYKDITDYIDKILRPTVLISSKMAIFDQLQLIKIWNNEEAYQALENLLSQYTKKQLEKKVSSLSGLNANDKEVGLACVRRFSGMQ